jgi:hypothetical protein
MAIEHPIEYELTPTSTSAGLNWFTLTVRNVGTENLVGLVKLNSLDAYSIDVYGTGNFVQDLKPGKEQALPFHAQVNATGWIYISLDGWKDAGIFHWESPEIRIGIDAAPSDLQKGSGWAHGLV